MIAPSVGTVDNKVYSFFICFLTCARRLCAALTFYMFYPICTLCCAIFFCIVLFVCVHVAFYDVIQARNQGGFGWFVRTPPPPHAITLVRLVRFSYMYSAS